MVSIALKVMPQLCWLHLNKVYCLSSKWIKLAKRAWSRLTHEDINLTAAALSYTTVLSLVPIIAVLLAVMTKFDYFGQIAPQVEQVIVSNISQTAGSEGVKLIHKAINRIQRGKLGAFGGLILLIVVTRTMLSLDRAVHRIWQEKNQRKLYQQFFVYWGLVLTIPVLFAIWVYSGIIIKDLGYQWFPINSGYLIVFFILLLFQRYLPSFKVDFFPVLLGTVVSTVLLYILTVGFTKLTSGVYRYSKIYGSLAAVPSFLLWVYMIWLSILMGTAVSSIFSQTKTA